MKQRISSAGAYIFDHGETWKVETVGHSEAKVLSAAIIGVSVVAWLV